MNTLQSTNWLQYGIKDIKHLKHANMHDPLIPFEPVFSPQGPTLLVAVRQSEVIRETPRHHHSCGQLIGAIRGLLTVDGGDCRWVVPATHAVWIPPGIPHGLRSHGPYSGWSVYVSAKACGELPDKPSVLSMTNLLREAITRAAAWQGVELTASQKRLAGVILDEIGSLPRVNLGLPMPQDSRLLRIAQALSANPTTGAGWKNGQPGPACHHARSRDDSEPKRVLASMNGDSGYAYSGLLSYWLPASQ